jgi:shikimate kinase
MARKIFLVGFMGCGKSSLGKRLARRSGWEFTDIDREVEGRAGGSVAEIFAERGEDGFRELEGEVVRDVAADERQLVVALGGGAVCSTGVMEALREAGTVVYLKRSPEVLVARMSDVGRARRPKIAGMDDAELLAYIEKILPEREKQYNKANFVVDCDTLGDEAVLRLLLHNIEE